MRWPSLGRTSLVSIFFGVVFGALAQGQPRAEHGLHYETPAMVWDEAMPLGNGLLGVLVWGDGQPLRLSLDRTDLWDLRPVPEFHTKEYSYKTMRRWVKEGRLADLHRLYDRPYGNPGPTKIPAGRIELTLGEKSVFEGASLDLTEAMATVMFRTGDRVRVFVHATDPFGMIQIDSKQPVDVKLLAPPFAGRITDEAGPGKISAGDLASLRYDAPVESGGDNWTGYLQEGWGGLKFAVVICWRKSNAAWLGAWSIATSNESQDPLKTAHRNCEKAMREGFAKAMTTHSRWWDSYWDKSSVKVPNPIIERQWYLEMYKFGAAARPDTPPITLQGPWTADNMKIPPWKGDYHHDLNTELSYWPAYSGNHLDGALGFVNWLWDTKDNARTWTKRFFGLPGLNVPMTADLNQEQIGGWHQYTHSSTTAAWLAHHFYLQWRYSMDKDFLIERTYPWLREVSVFLEGVTEKGPDGKRTLPLSSSPEINDNRLEAWFPTITNYDLALIRWTFEKTAELAAELSKAKEAQHWRRMLAEMPDLAFDPKSRKMLIAKDYPLPFSHRHFSHLMAIHPLGLIRWENGPEDRAIIKASLAELEQKGTSLWTGYSFSWLGNLAARARDGQKAEKALEIFSTAFCLRNSFHCNGDQSGKGYSNFRYRPFTLEGNFAAAAGLQEMLLQSYSGTMRVFPAVPADWKDVSFKTLRAEGAFVVSAQRKAGSTQSVEIISEKGGLCRLEDPFGQADYEIEGIAGNAISKDGDDLVLKTSAGQKISLIRSSSEPSQVSNESCIRPYAKNPRYWQYKGAPVLLLGGSKTDHIFLLEDLKEHLDEMVGVGGNYVRNTMSQREGLELKPYKLLSDKKFDLNQWNTTYWTRFSNCLKWCKERDIIIQIEVWDRFDYSQNYWLDSPWRPANNVNYTSEESGLANNYPAPAWRDRQPFFHTIPGMSRYKKQYDVVRGWQERFVAKMLSYSLKYPNVLYCMNNETSTPVKWGQYWMTFIKNEAAEGGVEIYVTDMFDDVWKPQSSAKLRQAFDNPDVYAFLDISQVNSRSFNEAQWKNLKWIVQQANRHPRPLNNTKIYSAGETTWGSGTPKDGVERFWRNLIVGSASCRFHRPGGGIGLNDTAKACIQAARKVEKFIKFWDIEPHMELLSDRKEDEAYLAAEPGKRYVLYFTDGGSVGLNLKAKDSAFLLRWVDITTGDWGREERISGGKVAAIRAPGKGGWVAVITKQ